MSALEITILGCGSSGGAPRADGSWGVCDPSEPKNRRSRCSLLVRRSPYADAAQATTVVVDTSPEFRLQMAAAGARRLDAVLMTHDHADQAHGLDDVRAFFVRQRKAIACWMDPACRESLAGRRFRYIFEGEGGYPAVCEARTLPPHGTPWSVEGPSGAIPVVTFDQDHGGVRSVGYRFGDVAYSSDVVELPPDAMAQLQGLDVFIVDALRYAPHPTHAHLDKALGWIQALRPARAILTNMHIDLDYATLRRSLPPGVEPAYDGLRLMSDIESPQSAA